MKSIIYKVFLMAVMPGGILLAQEGNPPVPNTNPLNSEVKSAVPNTNPVNSEVNPPVPNTNPLNGEPSVPVTPATDVVMQKAHAESAQMRTELNLTNHQYDVVFRTNIDYFSKADEINKNAAMSQNDKEQSIKTVSGTRLESFKNVLTPEQLGIFIKLHPENGKE